MKWPWAQKTDSEIVCESRTQKTKCKNCGATILKTTFERKKGLCAPCARGPDIAKQRRQLRVSKEKDTGVERERGESPPSYPREGAKSDREVKCSVCGNDLRRNANVMDGFRESGWVVVGNQNTASDLWVGTVCTDCQMVFCHECVALASSTCPNCSQKTTTALRSQLPTVIRSAPSIANRSQPQECVSPARTKGTAVRVLIAHTGETLTTEDANEVLKAAWSGRMSPDVRISSNPLTPDAWATDEKFAMSWFMWQQMLQNSFGEHPYWDDHEIHAFKGTIEGVGRFYIEIYYKR